ncbi:MAG: mitochondrial ribosomal small subunit component [Geoglossum simile]|nr:MAG: mitochondrial ribosomal small subunit component [Geoglossum simile]
MGRYDFKPLRVHQTATQLLRTNRIGTPPPWYDVVATIPPTQAVVRTLPVEQHDRGPSTSKAKTTKKPSKMFRPQKIIHREDTLRERFFGDHPWELARPRVVLEDDGKDGQRVVQRQLWLLENMPDISPAEAYDRARHEFYALRHQEDVERRVAKEEALAAGAYFGGSRLDVGMGLEDKMWETWKEWSLQESAAARQKCASAYTGLPDEGTKVELGSDPTYFLAGTIWLSAPPPLALLPINKRIITANLKMPSTPNIPLRALRERLEQLKDSKDPVAYEVFVQELKGIVEEKEALASLSAPSEPAAGLTENQVFQYFKLENERRETFNVVAYDIPRYTLRAIQNMVPFDLEFPVTARLHDNLTICNKTFNTRSEQFTRTAVTLVLMEVVHTIHQYQGIGHDNISIGPGKSTPASPDTLQPPDQAYRPVTPEGIPQTFPRKPLKIFSEYTANYKLQYNGSAQYIGGCFDLAVGYDGDSGGTTPLSALLFVTELKNTQESLDKAFPQLLAYMAMTYRTRQDQLKRNHNVYGLITNWVTWQFAMIENNILHKSNVLFLGKDLPLIMQFLGRTLLASALQTPTSSPLIFTSSGCERSGGADDGLQHIGKFRSVLEVLFEYEIIDVSMG